MIASELVLEQEISSLSDTPLGESVPLFKLSSKISASNTSFYDRSTEFFKSNELGNYQQTNNYFSGENSNTVFTKTSQKITTDPAAIDYNLASKNTTTPIDGASEIDRLTGNFAGQAIVGNTPTNYSYGSGNFTITSPSTNNTKTINLEYIRTNPNNIVLKSNNTTVPGSGSFGINGGFFVGGTRNIVSIAVNNDRPVNNDMHNDPQPLPPENRLGLNNDVTARGTLYWDGQTNTVGVAAIRNVSELKTLRLINDPNNYWAQGGISMALNSPVVNNGLPQQTINEQLGNITGGATGFTQRSALVYDNLFNNGIGDPSVDGLVNVYMIITRNAVTLGEFREAIKQALPNAEDGIFLDGGGSTQLNSAEAQFPGDGRIIPQIIALKA